MGTVYKRGNIWWLKYYWNGQPIYESSESKKKMVAGRLLRRREGELESGKIPGFLFQKVTFTQLCELLIMDYKINLKKSLVRAERSIGHLKKFFGHYNAPSISSPKINEYILERQEAGAANGTINRELSALKRMFNLGAEQTPPLVDLVPKIKMLDENNVRKGFFEFDQFLKVREYLPDYLRGFITIAYNKGWRLDEIETLAWEQVDRKLGIIRLEPGDTKNDDARVAYLDKEEKAIIAKQWQVRKEMLKSKGRLLPWVFLNRYGTDRLKQFHVSWKKACQAAGVPHRIFHDFRRTAVRNMVRAGVPENVAMKISGHKTRSVFDRYNIVNDADLVEAMEKVEKFRNSLAEGK